MNKKRRHIFPKYIRLHLQLFSEERTFEMADTMTNCMHLFKKLEEEQVEAEFTKENFTEGKWKNWREKY